MGMRGPLTSQIPLLTGIEILTIVAFTLSILTLHAGTSTNSLKESAILIVPSLGCNPTFNPSSINSALLNASIPDCYGEKTRPTSKLDTRVPVDLLTIGIALASVASISLLYGVVVLLLATITPPLAVLRVGYLASIPTAILLAISSAKITALADKMRGSTDIGSGVTVHAWMGWAFYVSTWLSAGFMWAAVSFSIVGAVKIASALQVQRSSGLVSQHLPVDKGRY